MVGIPLKLMHAIRSSLKLATGGNSIVVICISLPRSNSGIAHVSLEQQSRFEDSFFLERG